MPKGKNKRRSKDGVELTGKCCVISLDQSYTRCGMAIAVNGKLKKVTSIKYKKVKTKTEKRRMVNGYLTKAINSCLKHYRPEQVIIICERLRLFSQKQIRPNVIIPSAALIATIVDTAFDYGIPVYSVDTRAWKSAVLGSSKAIFEPIQGVENPQKFGSVRKAITLGFEEQITIRNSIGRFKEYDDDAADAACIALYGFTHRPMLKKEN